VLLPRLESLSIQGQSIRFDFLNSSNVDWAFPATKILCLRGTLPKMFLGQYLPTAGILLCTEAQPGFFHAHTQLCKSVTRSSEKFDGS